MTVQSSLACEHVLKGPHAGPHLVNNLLLHKVEAHCYQRHAQHQVHGAEDETDINFLALDHSFSWNYVSKPNRTEADEAKVGTVQEVPTFPLREQDGSKTNVPKAENRRSHDTNHYNGLWFIRKY